MKGETAVAWQADLRPYQQLAALTEDEYAALKADIQKRGRNLIPIVKDADTGETIDGFHREKACSELGLKPEAVRWFFKDDQDRYEVALVLNMLRRQMAPPAWARAFLRLAGVRGIDFGQASSAKKRHSQSLTLSDLATSIGTAPSTARRRLQQEKDLRPHPDLTAEVDAGKMTVSKAIKEKKKRERKARIEARGDEASKRPNPKCLFESDFREAKVVGGSVDAVIVDPPYAEKYLSLYAELSEAASHWLKPGGNCLVMVGQAHLGKAIDALSSHLNYVWTLAVVTPGDSTQVFGRKVKSNWKPVIWLTNGKNEWEHISDLIISEKPEKEEHEWQQSISSFKAIVERFTAKNEVVLDPMCGSGTTLLAAKELGRKWVGIDSDSDAIVTCRERLG